MNSNYHFPNTHHFLLIILSNKHNSWWKIIRQAVKITRVGSVVKKCSCFSGSFGLQQQYLLYPSLQWWFLQTSARIRTPDFWSLKIRHLVTKVFSYIYYSIKEEEGKDDEKIQEKNWSRHRPLSLQLNRPANFILNPQVILLFVCCNIFVVII